jgi:GNAT superfamily N-acetyltransferase
MEGKAKQTSIEIRKAIIADFDKVIALIDGEFTKEGFGFVNGAQVKTEIHRRNVWVAIDSGEVIGCRIGSNTLWNLIVSKARRGEGIGRQLVEIAPPQTVRVKAIPVGHLSKAQLEAFESPEAFYQALGYRLWGRAFPRNFWQRAGNKAQFHAKGNLQHILIYHNPNDMLFGTEEMIDKQTD